MNLFKKQNYQAEVEDKTKVVNKHKIKTKIPPRDCRASVLSKFQVEG